MAVLSAVGSARNRDRCRRASRRRRSLQPGSHHRHRHRCRDSDGESARRHHFRRRRGRQAGALDGRTGRSRAAHQAVRLDAVHCQKGDEADDDRPACEERRSVSQPHRARQHRRHRHRQGDLPHSELRTAGADRAEGHPHQPVAVPRIPSFVRWGRRTRTRVALGVLSCALAGVTIRGDAQAPSSTSATESVRQVAYLKASNPDASDHFGCGGVNQGHTGQGVAISADGTTLVVGAPHESSNARGSNGNQRDNSEFDAGAAYVFLRDGDRWAQQAYLKASNPQESAEFGHSVALSADGNTLAISAHWEASKATGINGDQSDRSIPQAGAVYVFTRRGAAWTQQAYIKASNTGEAGTADSFGEGDQFGFSLAISADGNTIAVGAMTEDSGSPGINGNQADNSAASAGAVYVFTRSGTTWSQQAYVKSANIDAGDLFGYAVALNADGNVLAVGAFDEDGSGRTINAPPDNKSTGAGAAYVFTRAGTAWSQQAYVKPSNLEAQDSFGVDVALSDDGNTLLVG